MKGLDDQEDHFHFWEQEEKAAFSKHCWKRDNTFWSHRPWH